jgi:Protein of unknown function, DUF488
MSTIYTAGHSTRSVSELVALLRQVSVDLLADVRSVPGSRTNPQFNADTLPAYLAVAGIAYRHLPALGGLRHRRKQQSVSQNSLWVNSAFRNYADYASTAEFRLGLDQLAALTRQHCCAIMCAEAVWWRCHRRIMCKAWRWRTSWGRARSTRRHSLPGRGRSRTGPSSIQGHDEGDAATPFVPLRSACCTRPSARAYPASRMLLPNSRVLPLKAYRAQKPARV